jgi:ABC-type multidrug transport system fused ATPase/permease subunit
MRCCVSSIDFMQAVGASERIFDLLDRQPKIPSEPDVNCLTQPHDFDGSVRLENVSFTYPTRSDQKVLQNITFHIAPGQKVALVGPSGGGKSTIASLIERFYDPESGTIFFGSHSLSNIDPHWLRKNVSFVNQEPSLFACSIRDNITFGLDNEQISLDDIQSAAKQANAHDFIEQFENKYDTLVGERGVRLSGGQRQRIASKHRIISNSNDLDCNANEITNVVIISDYHIVTFLFSCSSTSHESETIVTRRSNKCIGR